MEDNARLTYFLVESLNGIETVKSFNSENEVNFKTEQKFIKLLKSVFKNGWINNLQGSLKGGVKSVFGVVVLWIGAFQVIEGNLTVGELLM